MHIDCSTGRPTCTEVYDSEAVFGKNAYVGHDEPSTLFYSNVPGSGNRMRYQLTLPKDPSPSLATTPGVGYNFQLHPAFWFGMAMCDTQSYPEQVTVPAPPDSDINIVDPARQPRTMPGNGLHGDAVLSARLGRPSGRAGNELRRRHKWCAALNIDSLSQNAVTGAHGA